MTAAAFARLDRLARSLAPLAVTAFLVILNATPLPIPGYATLAPILALMSIYYWSIYRPDLMPSVAVFAVGLLHDALSGTPFGITALVLLLVRGAMISQSRFLLGKSFLVMWAGFAIVAVGAGMATWIVMSLLAGHPITPQPAIGQTVLTIVLFPCVAWLLLRVQRAFLRRA